MDVKYTFWNNKGGTGKTSLAFQTMTRYAADPPIETHSRRRPVPPSQPIGADAGRAEQQRQRETPRAPRSRASLQHWRLFQLRLPSP